MHMRNRAQREEHFHLLSADAHEESVEEATLRREETARREKELLLQAETTALLREDSALRREEVAQNAAFNQAFLGVLGDMTRAIAQRRVTKSYS